MLGQQVSVGVYELLLCICAGALLAHLNVSLWVEVMVPQDDLVVFASSGQQCAIPHLTQREHTAVMGLDLASDLKCSYGREGEGQRKRNNVYQSFSGGRTASSFSLTDKINTTVRDIFIQQDHK